MKNCLLLLCALIALGCTPDMGKVKAAATHKLTQLMGEPIVVEHAESRFNEGNGDPARVRIWARAQRDGELSFSISARYKNGVFHCDEERLRRRFAEKKENLKLTRAFVAVADQHFRRYAAKVERTSTAVALTIFVYELPCLEGAACDLFQRIYNAVRDFQKQVGALQLTVSFFTPQRHAPHKGKMILSSMPPKSTKRIRGRNSEYVIRAMSVGPDFSPEGVRAQIKLSHSGNAYYQKWSKVRTRLQQALSAQQGTQYHLQPGGSRLQLVPGSLSKVTHTATVCPVAHKKKSKRCRQAHAQQVTCMYEFDTGRLEITALTKGTE